jgi:hypothetical protein
MTRQNTPLGATTGCLMAEGDESPPRILSEFVEYSDFVQAVRNRVADLSIHGTRFDALAGWAEGYLSKLTSARPVRRIGMTSMGPLLSAMGVKLQMVEDPAGTARLRRLSPRNLSYVRAMPADACIVLTPRMLQRIRRLGGKARMARLTAKERSELARRAALARWRGDAS